MRYDSSQDRESVAESLGSITQFYEKAKDGDDSAYESLWKAYSKRLGGLASAVVRSRGLDGGLSDSIAHEAFTKFFESLSQGKYREVADRHELWCLLAVITRNTALNQVASRGRWSELVSESSSALELQADREPDPAEVAAMTDTLSKLELRLEKQARDPVQAKRLIDVLRLTLSGHTQRQVAEKVGRSELTVRRSLQVIRESMLRDIDEGPT